MVSCSTSSREAGESLIGTASERDVYILLEARFPWKYNILESKDVESIAPILSHAVIAGKPVKIFLIAYDPEYSRSGFRRMITLRKNTTLRQFDTEEYFVPHDKEQVILPSIFTDSDACTMYKGETTSKIIVVCVDGGHDKCCGLLGQPLYKKLKKTYPEMQVLQASHIGGHRFAPTCIDFVEGKVWGKVDLDRLDEVFKKKEVFSAVSHMYRGNCFLSQKEQYVEQTLLERYGWDTPMVFSEDNNCIRVDIIVEGQSITEHYTVEKSETVNAYGSCGDSEVTPFIQYHVEKRNSSHDC